MHLKALVCRLSALCYPALQRTKKQNTTQTRRGLKNTESHVFIERINSHILTWKMCYYQIQTNITKGKKSSRNNRMPILESTATLEVVRNVGIHRDFDWVQILTQQGPVKAVDSLHIHNHRDSTAGKLVSCMAWLPQLTPQQALFLSHVSERTHLL